MYDDLQGKMVDLGWSPFFREHFEPYRHGNFSVMRVRRENRGKYVACNDSGEFSCEVSGKFRFEHEGKTAFPTVGDWVVTSVLSPDRKAIIHAVLPRKSIFSRKVAGENTEEQPVAANIDTIFIITGLDHNYSVRRIERYLSLAWDSGAMPVVVLNKSDVCPEAEQRKHEVESIAIGVDVHTFSAFEKKDLHKLKPYLQPGMTVAFLGSSGVGKSTIINSLLGTDHLEVRDVNESHSRGRHTTAFRELILLPDGAMVIDTPGMRELQVWGDEESLTHAFEDIEMYARRCRFKDCSHEVEPGCAVREAIDNGVLDRKRFESYVKLRKEYEYLSMRKTMKPEAIEKAKRKKISLYARKLRKENRG